MFYYKKIGKIIEDWANDKASNDNRLLEILEVILTPMQNIVKLWQQDAAYIESNKNINTFIAKLYFYGNITTFLNYYYSDDFKNKIKEYELLGYKKDLAILASAKYFIKISCLKINNKQDFITFLNNIVKLNQLKRVNYEIKKSIIARNYSIIFENLRLINLIRKQNGIYSNVIGVYEYLDSKLGEKGEKIKAGDYEAIIFIESIEELAEQLQCKKDILEINIKRS